MAMHTWSLSDRKIRETSESICLGRRMARLVATLGLLSAAGLFGMPCVKAFAQAGCTITIAPGNSIGTVLSWAPPGSVVCLEDGTYSERVTFGRSGTSSAWIVLRAMHKQAATVLSVNIANRNYIEIDNLHVTGGTGCGICSNGGHHTHVIGNLVENMPGGGINLNLGDYRTITGNTVRNCSKGTSGNTSGISIWEATAFDTASGYHNIISYNIVYNNANPVGGTDGNGIIFDDADHTQSNDLAYLGGALIEENLAYANGGAGIKVYHSQKALARNNTLYWNHNFNSNSFTWRGEIDNEFSSANVFVNNIMMANTHYNSHNTAICECGSRSDTWDNNLTFNGTPGKASINGSISGSGNLLGKDPLFVNAAAYNFHLQRISPAIGAGTSLYGIPATDLDGNLFNPSRMDLGVYAAASTR
jgi:hypothetical protein